MSNFRSQTRKLIHDMILEIRKYTRNFDILSRTIVQDHDQHLLVYGSCYGDYASLSDINQQIAERGLKPEDTFIRATRSHDWDDNDNATLVFFGERKQNDDEYLKTIMELHQDYVPNADFLTKRKEYDTLISLRHTMDHDTFMKYINPIARQLYIEMYD